MYRPIFKIFFFLSALLFIIQSNAQTDRYMFHGAIKDKAGNLWFATTGSGLYRFDAITEKFTNYTMKDGLPSNRVSSVIQDRAGIYWINTESGICRYDARIPEGQAETFIKFTTKENCLYDVEL